MAPWLNCISSTVKRALPYLGPLINERMSRVGTSGETWEDKPVCVHSCNMTVSQSL